MRQVTEAFSGSCVRYREVGSPARIDEALILGYRLLTHLALFLTVALLWGVVVAEALRSL